MAVSFLPSTLPHLTLRWKEPAEVWPATPRLNPWLRPPTIDQCCARLMPSAARRTSHRSLPRPPPLAPMPPLPPPAKGSDSPTRAASPSSTPQASRSGAPRLTALLPLPLIVCRAAERRLAPRGHLLTPPSFTRPPDDLDRARLHDPLLLRPRFQRSTTFRAGARLRRSPSPTAILTVLSTAADPTGDRRRPRATRPTRTRAQRPSITIYSLTGEVTSYMIGSLRSCSTERSQSTRAPPSTRTRPPPSPTRHPAPATPRPRFTAHPSHRPLLHHESALWATCPRPSRPHTASSGPPSPRPAPPARSSRPNRLASASPPPPALCVCVPTRHPRARPSSTHHQPRRYRSPQRRALRRAAAA
jgi:hypothetical protein